MADGCNLYLTKEDLRQIKGSRENRQRIPEIADSIKSLYNGSAKISEERIKKVTYPLSDPIHPAHKVFANYVLQNVSGNQSIPESYKRALPKAVATIAKVTPDALGLVKPARGGGATILTDTLGHKTKGAGFAYEILGTARLIQQESLPKNSDTTGSRGRLKIYSTDRIDLGYKLTASYPGAQAELPHQPRRRTVEADLFIQRGDGYIAVDFKHSMNAGMYSGGISETQLRGWQTALSTEPLKEVHLVTNGAFSQPTKEAIDKINGELTEDGRDEHIYYHENVRYQIT